MPQEDGFGQFPSIREQAGVGDGVGVAVGDGVGLGEGVAWQIGILKVTPAGG